MLLRHAGPGQRPFAYLLLGDAAVAAAAVLAGRLAAPPSVADLLGAVSVFGFVGLLVVPPLLRDLTRRALEQDNLGLALWLTKVRELLSPGLGARQERDLIETVRA